MLGRLVRAGAAVSLVAGSALCTLYMLARADSVIGHDADLARFALTAAPRDQSLWSEPFVRRYYPFYFIGHAPQRFIVHGTYEWSPPGELPLK